MGVAVAADTRWLREGEHPGLLEALGSPATTMVGGQRVGTAGEQQKERRGCRAGGKAEESLRVFGGLFSG